MNVLITGGTGSFGQAYVRRVLSTGIEKVIVFSRDEQKHHAMQLEFDDDRLRFFVGDVRDRQRLWRALDGVDIVIHAAAMKHVTIAEYNPIEAIRTNVDGAANLIDAAIDRGVSHVVALSTDKAVSPVNLYGATKLCMEKLLIAANSYSGAGKTRFDLVRYGNVIGSKGSVVPLFLRQREEGKLTITDPSMTRFWIDMDRAVDLVNTALEQGRGGEVFVPMLPACSIGTLARALAPDCDHVITGIRPGEKLHESLITPDETNIAIDGDNYVITPDFPTWEYRRRKIQIDRGFDLSSNRVSQLSADEIRKIIGKGI